MAFKMNRITKEEYRILKFFDEFQYPRFVREKQIIYEIDFFGGQVYLLMKGKNLRNKLTTFTQQEFNEMGEYVFKDGTDEDKMYYYLFQIVQKILCKYYDEDGKLKKI